MAQVKFMQLGTNANPKKDYLVDNVNEYRTDLAQAIADYPGAIIFTTFKKSATAARAKNEIYANGQLYSAGGSGSGAVYVGSTEVTNGVISNFSTLFEGAEPEDGNVYIYSPNPDGHTIEGENIADRTAYYYQAGEGNTGKWVAFTGNVNAENVWFPNGVDRTEAWGTKPKDRTGQIQNECVDMNLREVLDYYLVKEMDPTLGNGYHNDTYPDWSISITNSFPQTLTIKKGSSAGEEVKSGSLVKVGDQFYLGAQTFTPSLSCAKAGDEDSQTYGPSYISGLGYGYWNVESEVGDKTKLKKDALTTKDHVGHIHSATVSGTITYNSTQTNGSNTLKVTTTNFSDSNSITSDTKTGSTALQLTERTLTTQEGVNKVKLELSVGNTWGRTAQSVTIPGINTVYACTNKGNISYTDATKTTRRAKSVNAKPISDTAATKNISDQSTSEFKVIAVNPIITNGVMFETETKTNASGAFYNADKTSTQEYLRDYISSDSGYWYFGFGQLNHATEPDKKWTFTIPSYVNVNVSDIKGNDENAGTSWGVSLNFTKSGNVFTSSDTAGNSVIRVKWTKKTN